MDKISRLKSSIAPIISLTDEEFRVFCDSFEVRKLAKNEFFLKEGQICDFIGLLSSGVVIYFKSMENGNEVTVHFAFEGDWVNNNLSRLNNSPSAINIKAIENSEILVIKQAAISELYIQIPKIERLGRILTEGAFVNFVEQTLDFQTLTATERYENLLQKHPEIFQRVQLYHIANYLGIAPKSLSRIRKEIFD
jgi:CRP-like cAMP-binding protein